MRSIRFLILSLFLILPSVSFSAQVRTGGGGGSGGSGSGTVNSGTANQVGYYASDGTTISGNNGFIFNGTNVGIGTLTPLDTLNLKTSSNGITVNYVGSGTGGIDTNTTLMLHGNGSNGSTVFTDSEATPKSCSASGAAQIGTSVVKFGSGAINLDGTANTWVNCGDSTDFQLGTSGTGNFTIDEWVYFNSFTGTPVPFAQGNGSTNAYYLQVDGTNAQFVVVSSSSVIVNMNAAHGITTGGWHHFAVIRGWAGGANTWAETVDGVAITTGSFNVTVPDISGNFYVGQIGDGTQRLNGYEDEFRLSKNARWTATFTPPSSEYVSDYNSPGIILQASSVQTAKIWTDGANSNIFKIDAPTTTRLSIDANGNVGIGTVTSSAGLSVMNGNLGIGTWKPVNAIDLVNSDAGTTLTSSSAAMEAIINTNTTANNFGDLSFGQNNSSGARVNTSKISGIHVSHTAGSESGTLAFLTMNAGTASEKMRIDNVGNIGIGTTIAQGAMTIMNGNVGIGTWKPASLLEIKGNVGVGTTTVGSTPYNLNINNVATFNSEFQIASNVGVGTTTVNWNNGVYQNVGIGTSQGAYIAFTHPTNGNVAKLQLRILEDGTGSRAIDFWPSTVKWSGGVAPTLTTTAAKSDFINCTWNGTTDYCAAQSNF